ncbi:helix-turn-helix domain-containing protein [Nocardiopsis sp. CA-288880]|uniref:helix-turn-helix domain-containing protein n=1 Tax=Nocardiopsis sp. CA-288880 TaxID=3239995 RepID=UPI003D984487
MTAVRSEPDPLRAERPRRQGATKGAAPCRRTTHRSHRPGRSPQVTDSKPEVLSPRETQRRLGVHANTLHAWADKGAIRVARTPGGHRRFFREDVDRIADTRMTLGLISTLGRGSSEFQKPVKPRRARDTKDST